MRISSTYVSTLLALTLGFLLIGCECTAETDAELCQASAVECGILTTRDSCEESRRIDCGGCEDSSECHENMCSCVGEDDESLCEALAMTCGRITVTDRCGTGRDLDCGPCALPPCELADSDTDASLCEENLLACGTAAVDDSCGEPRQVDCGECAPPEECRDHICICEPESVTALCARAGLDCGVAAVTNRCGEEVEVECGPCQGGNTLLGLVRDAQSGAPLGDAIMRLYRWPPPDGWHQDWTWRPDYRAADPDYSTRTSSSGPGSVNYEFTDEAGLCLAGARVGSFEFEQWYRIRIDVPGYHPGIFYRMHGRFEAGDCPGECVLAEGSLCHRQDFELWPYGAAYPRYADLMVDVRDLEDHEWQCARMPEGSPHEYLIGFRVSVAAANIGNGGFHIRSLDRYGQGKSGVVYQHIDWSDGREDIRTLDSATFVYYEPHRHTHLLNWTRLALVRPDEECRDPSNRHEDCTDDLALKVSFCLMDLNSFDEEIRESYDGARTYPNPPTCNSFEQGLTQGWKDVYVKALPGQAVILGPPEQAMSLGPRWVEVEIDPDHMLVLQNRTSTLARLLVEPPENIADLCNAPLDCTGDPETYPSRIQRWQCPAYVAYGAP
ncbi:MAG: hypothetical protein ACNA8W_04940 [Bradymonadaceae bacterium]